jgi:hypothetical protein
MLPGPWKGKTVPCVTCLVVSLIPIIVLFVLLHGFTAPQVDKTCTTLKKVRAPTSYASQ